MRMIIRTLLASFFVLTGCSSYGLDTLVRVSTVRTPSDVVLVIAENMSTADSADLPLTITEIADTTGSIYGDTLYVSGLGFKSRSKLALFYSCLGRRVGPGSVDTIMLVHDVPRAVQHIEFERCGRNYCLEISSVVFVPKFLNSDAVVVGLPRRFWGKKPSEMK